MINLNGVKGLVKNKSARESNIEEVESYLGGKLPKTYKEVLKETDGFSINGGKIIYGTDVIKERYETMEVEEYAEGYVVVGDDGEGNVFIMKKGKEDDKRVWIVGMGDMNPNNARKLADNFIEWVEEGCNTEEMDNDYTKYKIVLDKIPKGGLKGLINIKKQLKLNITAVELLKIKEELPKVLVEGYSRIEVQKVKDKLGDDGKALKVDEM